jgi:HK97 family phage major capsid protein
MSIAKNQMGGYILGGPPQAEAVPRLWGLPLVNTPEMAADDYLVGQFPANAALFDRESATVDVAYENEDHFIRNLVCFRCEERVALAVFLPQAFTKGPFRSEGGGATLQAGAATPAQKEAVKR